MKLLEDFRKDTANEQVQRTIDEGAAATTYGGNNYNYLKENLTGQHRRILMTKITR